MRTKSRQELESLDDDLKLFAEEDWDFLNVTQEDENYQYFNDVIDVDFSNKIGVKTLIPIGVIGVLVCFCCIWLGVSVMSKPDIDYEQFKASGGNQQISYVDGEEVSSDDLIDLSAVIQSYCGVLNQGSDYAQLKPYCRGTSVFADTYIAQVSSMKSAMDEHDCYARMIKKLGGYIKCNKIDRAIQKDNIIYTYVELNVPDKTSVSEWINLYKYNMTKYFTNKEATEQNIVGFLLETMESNPIPCTSQPYVLEYVETSEGYKLVDDANILSICTEAYNHSISQTSQVLGAGHIG